MSITVADVHSHLVGRKFPAILDDEDYQDIVNAALRDLGQYRLIEKLASFTTVDGVQDYYIFDPDNETTKGVCAGATIINDVIWSPGGDWSSLNIFSPGWIMLSQMVIFTGGYFHQPSQMMILRQKLDSFKQQFGSQGWQIFGIIGQKDAYIKLHPVPRGENKVVIDFSGSLTLTDLEASILPYFWQWAEYYAADTIANLYATTAGVDLLNFADSKSAMAYWEGKAKRYYDKAVAIQGGPGGCAMRS